jgi:CheY-like chemotaxis protein
MTELKHILLVEDSANDVALILAAFEEIQLANQVVVVRDGQEALDYLYRTGNHAERGAELPIVVLLDIKLPKIDGLEVLARLKNDPVLKLMPVVMLTSSREERDLVRSYGLGVNAYVVKPVSFPDFVVALREIGLFWAVVNQPPPTRMPST